MSAAEFDGLPLRVKYKKKIRRIRSLVHFSPLVGWLTSDNCYQNFALVNFFLSSVLCTPKFVCQVVLCSPQSPVVDRRSTVTHCRTLVKFPLLSQSLQVLLLLFILPYIPLKNTNKSLITTVVVWKNIFDASSSRLSRVTSIGKVTASSALNLDVSALVRLRRNPVAAFHCTCIDTWNG